MDRVASTISRRLVDEINRAACHHFERPDEVTLARQAALCAIPAPTGAEGHRAARVAELFRTVGLHDVAIDEVGNVSGWTAWEDRKSTRLNSSHVRISYAVFCLKKKKKKQNKTTVRSKA